jgi:hypothetical protein
VLDLSVDSHVAVAGKDRTQLFDGKPHVPGVDTGRRLRDWLENGVDPVESAAAKINEAADVDTLRDVCAAIKPEAQRDGWAEKLREMFLAKQEQIIAGEAGGTEQSPGVDQGGTSPASTSDQVTQDEVIQKVQSAKAVKHLDNIASKYSGHARERGFIHLFEAEVSIKRAELTNTPPTPEAGEVA